MKPLSRLRRPLPYQGGGKNEVFDGGVCMKKSCQWELAPLTTFSLFIYHVRLLWNVSHLISV